MVNHGTKLTYFGKLIALLSSPDLEKNVSSVDSDEKMLWFDAAYLTPDGSVYWDSGARKTPIRSLWSSRYFFLFCFCLSISFISRGFFAPFPLPSLSAIALFAPLDIYASWRRYLPRIKGLLLAWLASLVGSSLLLCFSRYRLFSSIA